MNKVLKVTKELIAESMREHSSHCMISETVRAQIPGARSISTDLQTIRFTVGDVRHIFLTPRKAQVAIINFDRGNLPAPFTLTLTGGQEIAKGTLRRLGNIRAPRTMTPADIRYARRRRKKGAILKIRTQMRAQKNATILPPDSTTNGSVPVILGGKEPPRIPNGARRQFGLRALER